VVPDSSVDCGSIIVHMRRVLLQSSDKAFTVRSGCSCVPVKVSEVKPRQKEFTILFNTPVEKGDKSRYVLEYDVEEPEKYFENAFLVPCGKFVVTMDYPTSLQTTLAFRSSLVSCAGAGLPGNIPSSSRI
jgi:hypothetical protein